VISKTYQDKRKTFFFIFIIAMIFFVTIALPRLSIPVIVSHIICLVISPAIPYLKKLGLSQRLSTIIVFLSFIALSIYPFIKVVPIAIEEAENIQYYLPKIENYLVEQSVILETELEERLGFQLGESAFPDFVDGARKKLTSVILGLPNYLGLALEWIFFIPLVVFFMLKDGPKFKRSFFSLAPNRYFERLYSLTHKFNKKLGDYIFAKFIEASLVGIIIWLGLVIMGVRFSVILALLAAITNIIPYVGPILGFAPALLFAVAEYGVESTFWGILILYLCANVIDMAIVFPVLVSKVVDLHPIVVVVSVIIGSQWLGVAGMIISIPAAAALKLIFHELYNELYLRS